MMSRPFPFEEVEAILVEQFGRPSSELFAAIDPIPVASASISRFTGRSFTTVGAWP